MVKLFRVVLLLFVFVFVAFYTKLQRLESTAWIESLPVYIYPINASGDQAINQYIETLETTHFEGVERFFEEQWQQFHDVDYRPIAITLQPPITSSPPTPSAGSGVLASVYWSLKLRWWSWQNSMDGERNTVHLYVIYHSTEKQRLAHSLGLQKGLIGVVNAYGHDDYHDTNQVVMAHEILHTVGASDKYDMSTGQPIFPEGFASPALEYEQTKAEIMAGKIPVSETSSRMAGSLRQCVLNEKTAREIGWINDLGQ